MRGPLRGVTVDGEQVNIVRKQQVSVFFSRTLAAHVIIIRSIMVNCVCSTGHLPRLMFISIAKLS